MVWEGATHHAPLGKSNFEVANNGVVTDGVGPLPIQSESCGPRCLSAAGENGMVHCITDHIRLLHSLIPRPHLILLGLGDEANCYMPQPLLTVVVCVLLPEVLLA